MEPYSVMFRTLRRPHAVSRRTALRNVSASVVAAALATGPASSRLAAREAGTPVTEEPLVGAFVGEVPAVTAFVAVVAAGPEAGADERVVRFYLCDGKGLAVWLTGSAVGNTVDLASEDGATVSGELTAGGAIGTVALPDGRLVAFAAPPATGAAGLYDVEIAEDGQVAGTAADGRRLDGRIVDELPSGVGLIAGTLALPDGGLQAFAVAASPRATGEFRFIVMTDGRIRGEAKRGKGSGRVVFQNFGGGGF